MSGMAGGCSSIRNLIWMLEPFTVRNYDQDVASSQTIECRLFQMPFVDNRCLNLRSEVSLGGSYLTPKNFANFRDKLFS